MSFNGDAEWMQRELDEEVEEVRESVEEELESGELMPSGEEDASAISSEFSSVDTGQYLQQDEGSSPPPAESMSDSVTSRSTTPESLESFESFPVHHWSPYDANKENVNPVTLEEVEPRRLRPRVPVISESEDDSIPVPPTPEGAGELPDHGLAEGELGVGGMDEGELGEGGMEEGMEGVRDIPETPPLAAQGLSPVASPTHFVSANALNDEPAEPTPIQQLDIEKTAAQDPALLLEFTPAELDEIFDTPLNDSFYHQRSTPARYKVLFRPLGPIPVDITKTIVKLFDKKGSAFFLSMDDLGAIKFGGYPADDTPPNLMAEVLHILDHKAYSPTYFTFTYRQVYDPELKRYQPFPYHKSNYGTMAWHGAWVEMQLSREPQGLPIKDFPEFPAPDKVPSIVHSGAGSFFKCLEYEVELRNCSCAYHDELSSHIPACYFDDTIGDIVRRKVKYYLVVDWNSVFLYDPSNKARLYIRRDNNTLKF